MSAGEHGAGDRVAVGLVVDQDAAEGVPSTGVECFKQTADVGIVIGHPRMMLDADASGEI